MLTGIVINSNAGVKVRSSTFRKTAQISPVSDGMAKSDLNNTETLCMQDKPHITSGILHDNKSSASYISF